MSLGAIGLITHATLSELDETTQWQRRAYKTTEAAQTLLGSLTDTQRGLRGYVLSGRADALDLYEKSVSDIPSELATLTRLLEEDGLGPDISLKLRSSISVVLAYSHGLLLARNQSGLEGAARMEMSGTGLRSMDQARATLQDITGLARDDQERRIRAATQNLTTTRWLVGIGAFMALGLLLLANVMAGRQARLRHSATRNLQLSEQRFRYLVDGVKDYALLMMDSSGTVLSWNTGAQRMYGYSSEEIIGRSFSCFYPANACEAHHPERELRIAARDNRYEEEGQRVRQDGSRFLAHAVISAIRDEDGSLRGFAKVTRDITESRRRDQALQQRNNELLQASRAKDAFLANMSHELRTPLNGIIGFSEILADELPGPVNAKQKEYLGDVLSSGRHLLQLINDLLDLAKVGAGKMEFYPQSFSVDHVIEEACQIVRPSANLKKLALVKSAAQDLSDAYLDRQRFKQILLNLLSNAVKFTKDGGAVEVTTARVGPDRFSISVRDTGIGIAQADIQRLFKEFEQLDSGAGRLYQGTGLGLALTHKLVTMQHGTIDVLSELGRGTTFTVVLPQVSADTGTTGEHPQSEAAFRPDSKVDASVPG